MKSIRSRLTVTFIGLIAVILAVIWGVNKWYLEDFYVTKKVQALNSAYEAIDSQIEENRDYGISIEDAMRRERDADGNITEGNLQRLIRNFSDSANVSVLIIDNSTEDATVYSTSRDTKFLKDRIDRYIFGWTKAKYTILEENDQYKIQKTYDPQRESMYLESWGFFSDNSTAFIMSAPLSSIGESVRLANQFLLYVGMIAVLIGALVIYLVAKQITMPIYKLSNLSERMSDLDFNAKYESGKHDMEEIQVLGNSMNTLSERLEETISELKSANNQLTKDIEEKTKIDEMRKDFIANVSHELKTPIALIQGYAEGLQEGISDDPESRAFYCDVIVDEAKKMNRMVRKLLTLNHLEFGQDALTEEPFDICEMLTTLLNSSALEMQKKEIKVIKQYPASCMVIGDEFKIEEVCTNYISNAMNHVNGDMRICVTLEEQDDTVKITVANTGDPIPEDSLDKVWIKFYKVDKARTREYGGSGIGLSIVKAIMDAHKQPFGVYNTAEGVAFWFCLKKAPKEETDVQENENDTGSME